MIKVGHLKYDITEEDCKGVVPLPGAFVVVLYETSEWTAVGLIEYEDSWPGKRMGIVKNTKLGQFGIDQLSILYQTGRLDFMEVVKLLNDLKAELEFKQEEKTVDCSSGVWVPRQVDQDS